MYHLFITLNGTEITNHNRKFGMTDGLNVNDIETAGGRKRRFYKSSKRSIDLNFTYLPDKANRTVDQRAGRDFMFGLAYSSPFVVVTMQDSPGDVYKEFSGYIVSYQEKMLRRDLKSQCTYYDLSFSIEER